jgi:hypothetical protein
LIAAPRGIHQHAFEPPEGAGAVRPALARLCYILETYIGHLLS